jgi:poly(A) polymerase
MGFPGGVAYAMLTARICQLYPNALPATLLQKFFWVYSQWNWPNPVMLCKQSTGGRFGKFVWGINTEDHKQVMPVITPVYPAINSTFRVTESTKRVITAEMERGNRIVAEIEAGKQEWKKLFEKMDFFNTYNTHLRINCLAQTEEEWKSWEGWVESRVVYLLQSFDRTSGMQYVHPYIHSFKYTTETHPYGCVFFIGLQNEPGRKVEITDVCLNFINKSIYSTKFKQRTPGMKVEFSVVKRNKLPEWVTGKPPRQRKKRKRKKTSENSKKTPENISNNGTSNNGPGSPLENKETSTTTIHQSNSSVPKEKFNPAYINNNEDGTSSQKRKIDHIGDSTDLPTHTHKLQKTSVPEVS